MTKIVSKNPQRLSAENYEKLIGVETKELLGQMRTGQLQVPKADYAEFQQFAAMTPEKRKAFADGKKAMMSTLPPDSSAGSGSAGAQVSGAQPDPVNPPAPKQDQSGNSGVPASGAQPDGSNYLVELSSLNKILGEQRAKNGQLGQTVKTLKQQNEELSNRLRELETKVNPPTGTPGALELPEMPNIPDPNTFVEGVYDEAYKTAMGEYNVKIKEWQKQLGNFVSSAKPKWAEELTNTLETVRTQAATAADFVGQAAQEREVKSVEQSVSNMWADVKAMQQATNLKTSLPIEVINQNQIIVNNAAAKNPDGTPVYSPEEVAAATRLIQAIPKPEYEAYRKVVDIVNNLYAFEPTGMPKRLCDPDLDPDLAWQKAIRKSGVTGITSIVSQPLSHGERMDRLSQTQQAFSAAPQMMNGSNIGGNDDPLSSQVTREEKMNKLSEMAKRINQNRSLANDSKFMESFDKLRAELGFTARKG